MSLPASSFISSQAVISFLEDQIMAVSIRDIAKAFKLSVEERPILKSLLKDMAEDGLIIIDDKRQIRLSGRMPEVVMAEITGYDNDGYGEIRIISDEVSSELIERSEIWLFPGRKRGRIPKVGARILARMAQVGPDQFEAHILRILPERKTRFFGRIVKFRDYLGIESAEKGARQITALARGQTNPPKIDDLVEAELNDKSGRVQKNASIIQNFGSIGSAESFIHLVLSEFEIPHHFSDEIIEQTNKATVPELGNRIDLREVPLVTIDGADAKDYDDAVFACPVDEGWRVIVAIADVSAYVTAQSPLDIEAQKRGNSVYLPGTVIPMLPEALSNGMCSLVPQEDRASLAVEIIIDNQGHKLRHKFMRALIKSHARLTYDAVQSVFEGQAEEADIGAPNGALHHLFGAWHGLIESREKRGTLNLNVPEKRVRLNDNAQPVGIDVRTQKEAHRLIEEFMILANICAAEELEMRGQPCVYRVHDRPDMEKIDGLVELMDAIGLPFAKGQVMSPHRFNQLLEAVKDKPEAQMVNDAVLRCQSRAVYDCENKGHYGLSLTRYAHFTSPIRRYADLLVHRALIEGCHLGDEKQPIKDKDSLSQICASISQTEQIAAKAERRTTDRLIACIYEPQLGRQLEVTITSIANFGIFASFDDGTAEGFMPMRSLPEDYYELDQGNRRLVGRRGGFVFTMGDVLQAQIQSVEPASGGILLTFLDGGCVDKKLISKHKKRKHIKNKGKSRKRR